MTKNEVLELLKQWYNSPPNDMVEVLTNLINSKDDTCEKCGCNEFLCGHNRRG